MTYNNQSRLLVSCSVSEDTSGGSCNCAAYWVPLYYNLSTVNGFNKYYGNLEILP
jgi:hypothetical protein